MNSNVQMHKETMVGDRIIYNKRRCTVIEIKIMRSSLRLVVKYDDETMDNLRREWNRYRVI